MTCNINAILILFILILFIYFNIMYLFSQDGSQDNEKFSSCLLILSRYIYII